MALKAIISHFKLSHSSHYPIFVKQKTPISIISHQRFYKVNAKRDLGIEKIKGLYSPVVKEKESKYVTDIEWLPEQHSAKTENCYDALNFTISGYDMVLVENYTKFMHRLMIRYRLNIAEIYGLPSYDTVIKHLGTRNTPLVQEMYTDYTLKTYQRVIRVNDISSSTYPILLQILMNYIPQSVRLSIAEHTQEDFKKRFMEKAELMEFRRDMDELLKR